MSRGRNLRLPSSSDEDEESPNPQILNPNPNPFPEPSSPPPAPPLEISDDEDAEFVDVPDEFSDPSPLNSSPNPNPNPNSSVDPIDELLRRLGLRLRREWLESCAGELERSGLGFERLDLDGKAKLCFAQFLLSDMNYCGAGTLPANVSGMHKVELEGPFVLQVDELVNICAPLRERYHSVQAGHKRCLKLSLTDGIQRVFGMEYRPIRDLDVVNPAGLKIIVRNVHIRRGLLMLVPEVLEVLGGLVEDLEEARKRLVNEIDKPPRGKRKQGCGPLPLAKRASLAAWPSATTDNGAIQLNVSMPQRTNNPQPTAQATTFASSTRISEASVIREFDDPNVGGNASVDLAAQGVEESIVDEFIASHRSDLTVEGHPPSSRAEVATATFVSSRGISESSIVEENDDPVIGSNSNVVLAAQGIKESTVNDFVAPRVPGSVLEQPKASNIPAVYPDTVIRTPPHVGDINVLHVEDGVGEVEHPLILTGDREIPFTYLACLLAKWTIHKDHASSIQGKIKCTLTGVKGFQYKHRRTYELHVYVDDGSLISEVVIDHQVVEKGIGRSPEEVSAALSSSDKQTVTNMKETMKKFQLFLAKFEGTILVEINENSCFPVALEMSQGCSTMDAQMLLRRLKRFTVPQKSPHNHLNPIDLSP